VEGLILLETGEGDLRYSRPAIELQLSETKGPLTLIATGRLVADDWNSANLTINYQATDNLVLKAQYFTGDEGHGKDTFQVGARCKLPYDGLTLTTSHTDNAFGIGARTRFGVQYYKQVGRIYGWSWITRRYRHELENWDNENWYEVGYNMKSGSKVALRRFESDFFGDNLTVRWSKQFE
jgi:hypothetical protein